MMTHSLHRRGDRESLKEDFVVLGCPATGVNKKGSAPKTRPVNCAEVAATIYKGLGIDYHQELPGPQGRPIPIVDYGAEAIKELF